MGRVAVFLLGVLLWGFANAQNFPSKPVKLIVGFPPGGGNDIIARLVGAKLQEAWGQPVLVENKPGANAIIATELAAKSAPDGYTLLVGASGAMTFNPGLYAKLPYDPQRDFAPVTMLGSFPLILAVNPGLAANSVKELVALAKGQSGQLNYAAGSTPFQLAAELFRLQAGVRINHIPYKGSAAMVNAAMANEVQLIFVDSGPAVPQVRAGRLRALAVTSRTRAPALPDVPTMAEAGMPDYEVVLWTSLFAPAGTPRPVIEAIHSQVVKSLQLPEVRERLAGIGVDAVGNTPEQLGAIMKADIDKWTAVAKSAGVKAD
ncbi:MAG TPA: tripartite tricarboxylate transporter substrate binding protein [Burkholderiales bacterium]|jgi:tripartite-type tricarboxylate transporter receptor subunit TctC|nr:tripartite tricarboxylate transporter substrate binding protein [Burkholderiales bacterium]